MNLEFIDALSELQEETGVDKNILLEAIEQALISAYKKNYNYESSENVTVNIDTETGEIKVFDRHQVVADISEVEDDDTQITLEYARKFNPDINVGEELEIEITPDSFGRIAAQTAKQVVTQRIREAERVNIYDQFSNSENEILSCIVNRNDKGNVYVRFGKAEGMIPSSETVHGEILSLGDHIKVYVLEVKDSSKGPQIICSRSHPNLIKKLFELEVPEIKQGIVELMSVAREAGQRTKIAVDCKEKDIDPVGACVGRNGMRIEHVVEELRGEKIDVVPWSSDPIEYIANSLRPAKVLMVQVNFDEKAAKVIVPDHQLSLAIGKEGQNARLAAKLTGWKIDIKSQKQSEEEAFGVEEETVDEISLDPETEVTDTENIAEDLGEIAEIDSLE